jgi:phosphoribosyl-ATP pyrophosphohydrolase
MIDPEVLQRLSATLEERKGASPDSSYVSSLYAKGTDAICKKVAEEAAESIMAAKDCDLRHIVYEVTDLWFHSLVLLAHFGLSADDVLTEMRRREGISGIEEKKARKS